LLDCIAHSPCFSSLFFARFLVDPGCKATDWLKTHLRNQKLEVVSQFDPAFMTALELAVRFGKTLVVQEVDTIDAVLFPLLRKDLVSQGPRFCVQVGDKVVDYNEDFRLFLATRNGQPVIAPDVAAYVNEINFTVTRAGLAGQLLAATIQHEKPELERRKTELVAAEEALVIQVERYFFTKGFCFSEYRSCGVCTGC
jgi:dynein heavy chain 2